MAAFQMCPRVGHLQAVYHMFVYLSTHERSATVLHPSYIKHDDEIEADWKPFYPGAQEELPPNMPPPCSNGVQMTCFVDADHAGDLVTRRS